MRFFTVILLIAFFHHAGGQTTIPGFGVITEEEKKITVCNFDPEADAVIIFDKAEANHNDSYNLLITRRIRMKILKEKGIRHGNISIYYYSKDDFESVYKIRALVVNSSPDGLEERKELSTNNIFTSKINDRWSEKKFALPDVRVGSIIEYEYHSEAKNYNGLRDWLFQSELPTMHSSFNVVILPNYEFAYSVSKSPDLPIVIKNDKFLGSTYFEMNNIAGLREEPFMDAKSDYLQKVEFQLSGYAGSFGGRTRYMTTWAELTKELLNSPDFGGQLNRNTGAGELLDKAKTIADPYEKMKLIYGYIQKNIISKNTTIYIREGVKDAWKNKTGTSAEVNLLLINLLKEAGLEVYPLLVSEREHGKVKEAYPFLDQFNNILAWVVIGDKKYVLDAAGPYTPPEYLPMKIVNTTGFIVDRKKGKMVLLEDLDRKNRNRTVINASISAEGIISGEVNSYSYDYARIRRKQIYEYKKEMLEEVFFTKSQPGVEIEDFEVMNLETDTLPLKQKFRFRLPINASGQYRLLNLNLFTGFGSSPFISDIRFTDVNYGYLQHHEIMEAFDLPEGWEPESLPKTGRMVTPDNSIVCTRYVTYSNNRINVLFKIELNKPVFPPSEYPMLKEFFKKMTNMLDEQVIIKPQLN